MMQDTKYILLCQELDGIFAEGNSHEFDNNKIWSLCEQVGTDVGTLYNLIAIYCQEKGIPLEIGGDHE